MPPSERPKGHNKDPDRTMDAMPAALVTQRNNRLSLPPFMWEP